MGSGTVPARYGQSREVGKERESVVCPWAICPPPPIPLSLPAIHPPPPLVRARGEEGEGSASMLTHRPREREGRGRGDQPGREGERGSNTSHSRDISC